MYNIEELDDFELAIHEKLANYETTPPVGSWNAILQNSATESRKLRMVWVKRRIFMLVLVSSMSSMWFAFGSIMFDLDKFNLSESKFISQYQLIRYNYINNLFHNTNTENKIALLEKKVKKSTKAKAIEISIDREVVTNNKSKFITNDNIKSSDEISLADIRSISTINIENSTHSEFSLSNREQSVYNFKKASRISLNVGYEYNLLIVEYKKTSPINSNSIENKLLQHSNGLRLSTDYSLNKNLQIITGINLRIINQANNYTEEQLNKYIRIDTTIIGYIQDPIIGKLPVYNFESVEVTGITQNNAKFYNTFVGIEIPISLSYKIYKNKKFNLILNAAAEYSYYSARKFNYFNDELILKSEQKIKFSTYNTVFSVEANYKLNTFLSLYIKPSINKSTNTILNSGLGLGLGVKYNLY